ncbi:class E basic helix-loop-helix protein 40-like [Scleropages formosus]|uniref:Basic helix-loop-helix family member e40 n=1 Tax=Scleropages formosus TaxID=113540 RepID=A0A0P7UEW7_SCLFO|nr:class E basic helix-loop-helix protein 40-like [Scleropages formosus]KPP57611.1 class E basic helix-loop-helix protein 40-like [Scleropages formosus]
MERITSAQPPPCMEMSDVQRMEFPLYMYKSRRGMKRSEDSKLPHRLIEKKRRDRINECIAQLKDLLPEHLKLTTLGHLEKAVVLELTLKHVKALTSLLEQQQQKIVALQNGLQIGELPSPSSESNEEMFRAGFHLCAKEVLQFLSNQEGGEEVTPSHVVSHLQKVASEVLQGTPSPRTEEPVHKGMEHKEKLAGQQPKGSEGHGRNCVPVIQRTYTQGGGGEQSGSDTDTDSGYGGELEKTDCKTEQAGYYEKECQLRYALAERMAGAIKQETDEPQAKRLRAESSEDESLLGGEAIGIHGSYVGLSPHQPPLCMPFYLIPPSAAAYLPMLEKCWYPGAMPVLYPGLSTSGVSISPEKLPQSFVISSRVGSPGVPQTTMDSPALLQALKQVPPLNMETKD